MTNPFEQFTQDANPFEQFKAAPSPEASESSIKSPAEYVAAARAERLADDPNKGEATFTEAGGRGMLDVYEGGFQLVTNIGDKINDLSLMADRALGEDTFARKAVGALEILTGASMLKAIGGNADKINKNIENELKLYSENNPDFQWGRLAGGLATPLTLIPGAGATTAARVGLGVMTGAVAGATQPVQDGENFWETKALQTGAGATIGAVIPGGMKAAKIIYNGSKKWLIAIAAPFSKKAREAGIAQDIHRFLIDNVTENKDKIIAAIERSIGEGDGKTVGQIIAENTKGKGDQFGKLLVRLEKDLSRESDALETIWARQDLSRREFIDGIAGKAGDLIEAKAKRAADGAVNYEAANGVAITADRHLSKIVQNKYAQKAIKTAQDMAEVKNINPKANLTEFLHDVKLGLDKQLGMTGDTALASSERKLVGQVKDELTAWLGNKNPLYEKARTQWQMDSAPINRMEVGKTLKDALVSSLGDAKPATFATAVRDAAKTIKKSTGFSRFNKLDDVLHPEDVSGLNRIVSELKTEAHRGVSSTKAGSLITKLKDETTLSLPHILSRPIVIANHVLRGLGKDQTPAYKKLLSHLMANPDEFLRAYKLPQSNPKAQMAMDIVAKLNTIASTQQVARE